MGQAQSKANDTQAVNDLETPETEYRTTDSSTLTPINGGSAEQYQKKQKSEHESPYTQESLEQYARQLNKEIELLPSQEEIEGLSDQEIRELFTKKVEEGGEALRAATHQAIDETIDGILESDLPHFAQAELIDKLEDGREAADKAIDEFIEKASKAAETLQLQDIAMTGEYQGNERMTRFDAAIDNFRRTIASELNSGPDAAGFDIQLNHGAFRTTIDLGDQGKLLIYADEEIVGAGVGFSF